MMVMQMMESGRMANLDWKLLPWQLEAWKDESRFKVIVAGRRCGKSNFSIKQTIAKALEAPKGSCVLYVAPTQAQARQIAWDAIIDQGKDVLKSAHINSMDITFINGVKVHLRSAENPDNMRGLKVYFAVLDEAAFIKDDNIWNKVIRPALSDLKGDAVFISSPSGRNWFYELYNKAKAGELKDWKTWHLTTLDNPTIDPEEIEDAKKNLSSFAFRQEFMASFDSMGSDIFKEEWIKYNSTEPKDGEWFIAVDLAGFQDADKMAQSSANRLDLTSIAVVKVNTDGWYVKDIIYGRWGFKETAEKIFDAVKEYQPRIVGIEKGVAKQAIMSPLLDLMKQRNFFFSVYELSHGNKRKYDRIIYALQGRFEHGRIVLNKSEWNAEFLDQLYQFPNQRVHDDLIDSLAYIDQIANISYITDFEDTSVEPLDIWSGY
jgi:predicted phage terminase large subunit-like protein